MPKINSVTDFTQKHKNFMSEKLVSTLIKIGNKKHQKEGVDAFPKIQ